MKKIIQLKVQPRASREKVVKVSSEEYKVYTTKPALDGKANKAIIELLAEFLGVKRYNIKMIRGEKTRNKIVEIRG